MIILHSLEEAGLPLSGTVVALGMFDGVHRGHRQVLDAAVEEAGQNGLAPCAFTFALSSPRTNFKKTPLLTDTPTLTGLLEEMGFRYVLAPDFSQMKDMEPEDYVVHVLGDILGAKVLCCGENFTFARGGGSTVQNLMDIAEQVGIRVRILTTLLEDGEPVSSTRIRRLIEAGDLPGANRLLGRSFSIGFAVVQGNRIGRTLGTPTINQPFPGDFVVPRYGVYATIAHVDGVRYSGVTNVGLKPTVGSDTPLAETYIQGFSGDLYGRKITVSFLEFIRPEVKFGSLDELRCNILKDAQTAARIAQSYMTDEQ